MEFVSSHIRVAVYTLPFEKLNLLPKTFIFMHFLSFQNHAQSLFSVTLFYDVFLMQYHRFEALVFPRNEEKHENIRKN